ncbi:MAG TPA: hypothetical protein VIY55_10745 [Acetobacteraceae bacterium]
MSRRLRHRPGFLGLLIAGIALVSQLALGAILPTDDALAEQAAAAFNAVAIFCAAPQSPDHNKSSKHQPAPPLLCPASTALALPGVVLTPAPLLPPPPASVLSSGARERPPGRGPPPASARVGPPRAPPFPA